MQHLVVGGVAHDAEAIVAPHALERRRIHLDDDVCTAGLFHFPDHLRPRPSVAADDDVVAQRTQLGVHPPVPPLLLPPSAGELLDDDAERVEKADHPQNDQGDREHLAGVVEGVDLLVAHGGDGDDGHEQRVEEGVLLDEDVADDAVDEHQADGQERRPKPPQRAGQTAAGDHRSRRLSAVGGTGPDSSRLGPARRSGVVRGILGGPSLRQAVAQLLLDVAALVTLAGEPEGDALFAIVESAPARFLVGEVIAQRLLDGVGKGDAACCERGGEVGGDDHGVRVDRSLGGPAEEAPEPRHAASLSWLGCEFAQSPGPGGTRRSRRTAPDVSGYA